jgi:PAS domain S-box-containing protein
MRSVRRASSTCSYRWLRLREFCNLGWLIFFCTLLSVLTSLCASAQSATKNVLILHDMDSLPRSWAIMESTVRSRVPAQINFYTTSVENPRFYEESYRESLADTLQRGYSGVKLDAVVAASYSVLQFVAQYRDRIFPGVPIVFTDVSVQQAQKLWPGVTGVVSTVGLKETIELALRLQPDTKNIAVVTGETEWDTYWLAVAHSELLPHVDKIREIDITGPADRRLLDRVDALPPHTVVLFQLRPDDKTQLASDPIELLTKIAQRVPTYSAWSGLALDRGGIGGAYRDLPKEAAMNGEQVARVLLGQRPEDIPVLVDTNLKLRVDWPALQHWHIPESALPPGTEIDGRRPSFWQRDRKYIIGVIVLVVAQFLLISLLLLQRSRKRRAEAVLKESEERFRLMADTTPALVWMCDAQGKVTYVNDRWMSFTGGKGKAGLGDTWIAYVHSDDVSDVMERFSRALKERQSFSTEFRMRRNDGVYRWIFDLASPRVNGDGSFGGFIGSAIDTTDQKLAQQALEKVSGQLIEAQEKERSRIARDLHDDICQRLALLSMELVQVNRGSAGLSRSTKENLEEIRRHCSEIATDVQSLSHQLHSSKLDYLGIAAAIRGFCKEFSRQHEVEIEFTEVNVPKHVPKDVSLCFFRVTQEALHNALKYSGTGYYSVELRGTLDEVRLEVRDSGAGFDQEEAKNNRGLGLMSMQERVHLVHGTLVVESAPGMGTKILAVVPLLAEHQGSSKDSPESEQEHVGKVA